jgi:UDP-galactopyranose mutase
VRVALEPRVEWTRDADIVVVGAGFFGLTIAERIAAETNKKVTILECRDHIGGNAHSYIDEASQVEVHSYGSHLFHTNNLKVWDYVNKFTKFNDYEHRVYAIAKGEIYSLPLNLQTLSQIYPGVTSVQAATELIGGFAKEKKENFQDMAVSLVGELAYELFIKNYTQKQWQTDPKKLPPDIISRLPVRTNLDGRYFSDKYQGLPLNGYQQWHEQMIDNEKITVQLNTDFFENNHEIKENQFVVYTGPIDKYFDYKHGMLGWRTLDFKTEVLDLDDFQGNSVVNYCDVEPAYTRIHEFKHLHPEREYVPGKTVIMREFSRFAGENDEPYYPINTENDRNKLLKYREEATQVKNVFFGGRLGSYQYLDMHMAIASALSLFENELKPLIQGAK